MVVRWRARVVYDNRNLDRDAKLVDDVVKTSYLHSL